MLIKSDIQSDWSPEDISYFVALVANVQSMIKKTTSAYGRMDQPVLPVISRAVFVALKGLHIESGIASSQVAAQLSDFHNAVQSELATLEAQTKELIETFEVKGRA